jgi:hypothetical protein
MRHNFLHNYVRIEIECQHAKNHLLDLIFIYAFHCLCFVVDKRVCGGITFGIRPIVAALPSWFRLAQCFRRYRDTRQPFPHLANAGKYATTFLVVLFSTLHSVYKSQLRLLLSYL